MKHIGLKHQRENKQTSDKNIYYCHKEVQRTLIDIFSQSGLTQLHEDPTRENNLLDLIFTTNPTLAKTSTNIHGDLRPCNCSHRYRNQAFLPKKTTLGHLIYRQKQIDRKSNINDVWNTFKPQPLDRWTLISPCLPGGNVLSGLVTM
jgi:hypothetical protein